MNHTNIDEFIATAEDFHQTGSFQKLTLSKPRNTITGLQNIYIRPVLLKEITQYQCTFRYNNKDEVKNYSFEQLKELISEWLQAVFLNGDLMGEKNVVNLIQSIKGNSRLLNKKTQAAGRRNQEHNREKKRLIQPDRLYLQLLGISDSKGRVYDKSQDKFRQINKYVEIADSLISNLKNNSIRIADMGSGKGYLSFALYDYLTSKGMDVQMTGYDIRMDMIQKCNDVAEKSGFRGLKFKEGDINTIILPATDVVIALHACDIATDMAIAKAIESNAQYIIVAPCCHKQIRKNLQGQNLLSPLMKHGILEERMAEIITDGLRALLLESEGYSTKVFEFISSEHTAKNVMITGIKGKINPKAKDKVNEIKAFYGISYHHLEKLLNKC